MPVLEIIQPDNPTLRKKAHKVNNFKDARLQTLIENMIETLSDAQGVGLAAPQVAVSQRLIIVRLPDDEDSKEEYGEDAGVLHVVANPEIARASDLMVEGVEGCLSIPGVIGTVDRHESVTVKGQDRNGKAVRIKAKGWLARVFQHEIDHLDGVLYIDKAKEIWRPGEQRAENDEAEIEAESSAEETPEEA